MTRKGPILFLFVVLGSSQFLFSQNWSGILSPSRAIDWSGQGVRGDIPTSWPNCTTAACNTLFGGTVTSASVNAAIASAPDSTVVRIPAGSFTLNAGARLARNNVILRGAGANQTFLSVTGTGLCGYDGSICVENAENASDNPQNIIGWTAGYAQHGTTVTLSGMVSGSLSLSVGDMITLDQLNDGNTDNGQVWACDLEPYCASEGGEGITRPNRSQGQQVIVASCDGNSTVGHACSSGTNLTISPGLYMPNWNDTTHGTSQRSPQAWWSSQVHGVGLEEMSIDHTNNNATFGIVFLNAHDCWVSGVRSIRANRANVFGMVSSHITVRSSYFFGTINSASTSYGFETDASSDWLAENNIFQQVTGPINWGKQASGNVAAYNFAINDLYISADWMQASYYHHASGMNYNLFEGNIGPGFTADDIHGTQHFATLFRNRLLGWDPGRTAQTDAIDHYAYNRYFNYVGNVLGKSGFHTTYECYPATASSNNCGAGTDLSIYVLGWSSNSAVDTGVPNDVFVRKSIMRWGNWDTVTNASQFNSAEVPSGLSVYANPVPASQSLPASFYLSGKPSWWGTTAWPAIGPDVTGGNLAGSGGHANQIPAGNCFASIMSGPTDGTGSPLSFSTSECYSSSTGPALNPPSGLSAVVN